MRDSLRTHRQDNRHLSEGVWALNHPPQWRSEAKRPDSGSPGRCLHWDCVSEQAVPLQLSIKLSAQVIQQLCHESCVPCVIRAESNTRCFRAGIGRPDSHMDEM